MKPPSRKSMLIVLASVLLAGALSQHPYLEWRVALIGLKLAGDSGQVRLELVQEGEPCPALWVTPLGKIWGRLADEPLLEALFHEQSVARIYQNEYVGISHGDVVLDVGGHLGTFTLSALASGASLVVAFEPEPTNIVCYRRSFAEGIRAGRVILIEAAAWHEPATLKFTPPPVINTGLGKVDEASKLLVDAIAIDSVVESLDLDRLDFIKMDIEGSERHALAGAREAVAHFKPRMALSIYHLEGDSEEVTRLALEAHPEYAVVQENGFAYFW